MKILNKERDIQKTIIYIFFIVSFDQLSFIKTLFLAFFIVLFPYACCLRSALKKYKELFTFLIIICLSLFIDKDILKVTLFLMFYFLVPKLIICLKNKD